MMKNRKGGRKPTALSLLMMVLLIVCSLLKERRWHRERQMGDRPQKSLEMAACMRTGDHEIQEEVYKIGESPNGLFAVTAGGQRKQKEETPVSRIITGKFVKVFHCSLFLLLPKFGFLKAFQTAQKAVYKQSRGKENRICTAAVFIRKQKLYYGTMGGGIVAIVRNGRLIPVTKGRRRRSGAEIFSSPVALFKGESVVLISRGLYKAMKWEEIEGHVKREGACVEKVFKLMERLNLNNRTKKTNASVVLIKVL